MHRTVSAAGRHLAGAPAGLLDAATLDGYGACADACVAVTAGVSTARRSWLHSGRADMCAVRDVYTWRSSSEHRSACLPSSRRTGGGHSSWQQMVCHTDGDERLLRTHAHGRVAVRQRGMF
jgi:hypothetical protein